MLLRKHDAVSTAIKLRISLNSDMSFYLFVDAIHLPTIRGTFPAGSCRQASILCICSVVLSPYLLCVLPTDDWPDLFCLEIREKGVRERMLCCMKGCAT